jgi:hypothetical protein
MNIPGFAAFVFCGVSFFLAAPSVLAYSTELQDSLLFVRESETADNTQIDLRDALTDLRLALRLPAQRAAIALIGKHEKTEDFVIRLQSRLPPISLCFLGVARGVLFRLRQAIFKQSHSYADH